MSGSTDPLYFSLTKSFANMYKDVQRMAAYSPIAVLAVIMRLGFVLSASMAGKQRNKEIGIRKVLSKVSKRGITMLSKRVFVKLL